jgi:predicted porin
MKKSLLALAVLGAFAGAASAQSSVTLFGVVDAAAKSVKNGDTTTRQLGTDGLASSRLGFRGVEDLGGGLQAGFWLEAGVAPDAGTAGGSNTTTGVTAFFNRRSTVSLMGGFGEVRLGRDYTPSFWNLTVFDPFGTNGVGSYLNLFASGAIGTPLLSGAKTLVRADNTIGYFLPPNLGGFYGQVQVGAPEGGTGNKYVGARVGYGVGPVNVAGAWGRTRISGPSVSPQRNLTMIDFGGSYDVGFAQFMAQYSRMTAEFVVGAGTGDAKQTNYLLGVLVPMGQGQIRASYARAKGSELADPAVAKLYALGYVYNLSKRTALYGTYARIRNDGGAAFAVGTPPAVTAADLTSSGYEVGIRHSF